MRALKEGEVAMTKSELIARLAEDNPHLYHNRRVLAQRPEAGEG